MKMFTSNTMFPSPTHSLTWETDFNRCSSVHDSTVHNDPYRLQNVNCSNCGKDFNTYNYLTNHINTHNVKSPFVCQRCGKNFINTDNLSTHIEAHHVTWHLPDPLDTWSYHPLHYNLTPFKTCEVCDKFLYCNDSPVSHDKSPHENLLSCNR